MQFPVGGNTVFLVFSPELFSLSAPAWNSQSNFVFGYLPVNFWAARALERRQLVSLAVVPAFPLTHTDSSALG